MTESDSGETTNMKEARQQLSAGFWKSQRHRIASWMVALIWHLPESLFHTNQFDDAAGRVPILHVKIAIFIKVRSVSSAENALNPFFLRDAETSSELRVEVVTENRDDRVALVENYDSPVKVGDRNIVAVE
jgi:hypothetical protein